jgi:hypothetical protein
VIPSTEVISSGFDCAFAADKMSDETKSTIAQRRSERDMLSSFVKNAAKVGTRGLLNE